MKNVKLLPHNQEAFEMISKAFETSQRVCTIRATGTGKSYITAALVKKYKKVLILAPSKSIISQNRNIIGDKYEYMTYSKLTSLVKRGQYIRDDYEFINLDEFHRPGSEEWGKAIKYLLDRNPQAKIFGTTATHVRYLDNQKDMADELFGGNSVANLPLPEVWKRNILTKPRYILGYYKTDNIFSSLKNKIIKNSFDSEEAEMTLSELDNIRLDWKNIYNVEDTLKKNWNNNTERIIVFCDRIDDVPEYRKYLETWLGKINIKIEKSYSVNSKEKDSFNQIKDFEKPVKSGYVKIIYSINMLNEGVHIPSVDTIIMFRPTTSKIIFLQQIGRCLSANTGKEKEPSVIFDFVDNLDNNNYLDPVYMEYLQMLKSRGEGDGNTPDFTRKDKSSLSFKSTGKGVSIEDLYERISELFKFRTPEEWLEEEEKFFKTHQRYPNKYSDDFFERRLYNFLYISVRSNNELVIEFIKKHNPTIIERLAKFYNKNNRYPRDYMGDDEELVKIYKITRSGSFFLGESWNKFINSIWNEISEEMISYGYVINGISWKDRFKYNLFKSEIRKIENLEFGLPKELSDFGENNFFHMKIVNAPNHLESKY